MTALILMIAAAIAGSIIFKRKLHETLPVAVFTVTLAVYAFALILPLTVSVYICAGIVALVFILSAVKSRGHFITDTARDLCSLIPLFIVCLIFCSLFYNRRVFYFDDLSYWALYTKNIFAIDKLPHLFENCSVNYKDYTPIIQVLQYLVMFGKKSFSEPLMFRTNICLIYILTLPILFVSDSSSAGNIDQGGASSVRKITPAGIVKVVMYVIFPHILTAQFYYRLGVDLLLALVFGYVLFCIYRDKRSDIFTMIELASSLAFLALIKTSGIVLCLLAVVMFALYEFPGKTTPDGQRKTGRRTTAVKTLILLIFTLGSYFSWQLFLRYSWNNGYLSNRVKDGVSGAGFSFPDYTGEVIANYIIHFFTYPLTRNVIGVTSALLVAFIAAVYVAERKAALSDTGLPDRSAASDTKAVSDSGATKCRGLKVMFISVMSGLLIFMIAHLSMYLFVFDEWEAHGLLEFDRYITQYLGGAFFVYMCMLMRLVSIQSGTSAKKGFNRILLFASATVFVILLPYSDMKHYLVPAEYDAMFENEYGKLAGDAENEWNMSGIKKLNLPHDGSQKLTVVGDAWDETMQFIEYTAVPQPINRIVNVPAVEPGRISGFIMESVDEYVYVCNNAPGSYTGNWEETKSITSDGSPLLPGALYKTERSDDAKTLKRILPDQEP